MNKQIIFGVLALVVLSAVAFAGCQPAPITVNVPAPQIIQAPATTPSATGLMGNTVQDLIQMQMLKSVLDTGTGNNNGGWHGGHHHGD